MNEERTGKCLREKEHIRGHLAIKLPIANIYQTDKGIYLWYFQTFPTWWHHNKAAMVERNSLVPLIIHFYVNKAHVRCKMVRLSNWKKKKIIVSFIYYCIGIYVEKPIIFKGVFSFLFLWFKIKLSSCATIPLSSPVDFNVYSMTPPLCFRRIILFHPQRKLATLIFIFRNLHSLFLEIYILYF
jgi:hypothetical protein